MWTEHISRERGILRRRVLLAGPSVNSYLDGSCGYKPSPTLGWLPGQSSLPELWLQDVRGALPHARFERFISPPIRLSRKIRRKETSGSEG